MSLTRKYNKASVLLPAVLATSLAFSNAAYASGSVVEACARGAATTLAVNTLIVTGGVILDFLGCLGFCSATAATVSVSMAAAASAGCAAGVVEHVTNGGGTTRQPRPGLN